MHLGAKLPPLSQSTPQGGALLDEERQRGLGCGEGQAHRACLLLEQKARKPTGALSESQGTSEPAVSPVVKVL